MRHPSPFSSFTMLVLFSERKMNLSEKQFDFYFDEVTAALERANNERFRLTDTYSPELSNNEKDR